MQGPTETNPCPQCSHQNTADTNFCGNCGLHIDGLCPTCSTQSAHSTHYCGNCGFDFTTPPQPASPPPSSMNDLRSQQSPPRMPSAEATPPRSHAFGIDCPRCHHANEPGAVFCYNCGLPFDSAAGFRPANAVGGIPAYATGNPGGFWIRFVALIIDGLVSSALVSALLVVFTDVSPSDYMQNLDSSSGAEFINWTVSFGYAPVLLGIWATTVGKRAFNMYVLKLDGTPVGFWRALGREVAKIISFVPFLAGFWIAAFRDDKRTLHDLIAGTVVVQR